MPVSTMHACIPMVSPPLLDMLHAFSCIQDLNSAARSNWDFLKILNIFLLLTTIFKILGQRSKSFDLPPNDLVPRMFQFLDLATLSHGAEKIYFRKSLKLGAEKSQVDS